MTDTFLPETDQEYGLVLSQPGERQPVMASFLKLIMQYRYGLGVVEVDSLLRAFSVVQQGGEQIRCAFAVLSQSPGAAASLASLNLNGRFPLVCVFPANVIEQQKALTIRQENTHYVSWDEALGQGENSLYGTVVRLFAAGGIGDLFSGAEKLTPAQRQRRIEHRLRHINTLPTFPQIVLKVMKLVADPQGDAAALEELLAHDSAIVHKLLQVVNAPIFTGPGHNGRWTLHESIVRLGTRKVAAIAQQIRLMNSFVRPQESRFDLQRFWSHSVACALIADRLVSGRRVQTPGELDFGDYWIAALLHDIGKLVLGFYFWDRFAALLEQMDRGGSTFRQAEREMGDVADHEYLGGLLLVKSRGAQDLTAAVRSHHTVGNAPGSLACLVHVANQLTKPLGLGYREHEPMACSPMVLDALRLDQADLARLAAEFGSEDAVPAEVAAIMSRCLAPS